MSTRNAAVHVDLDGLAQVLERRGKSWVLAELYQNARDAEQVRNISISIAEGRSGFYNLTVADDSPNGWIDLSHAWTLFAPSPKRMDGGKVGYFNMGEKMIVAVANRMVIQTMRGTITFTQSGRRMDERSTACGTTVSVELKLSAMELSELKGWAGLIIPDEGVTVTLNGSTIRRPIPLGKVEDRLPCPSAESPFARMSVTNRKTTIEFYEAIGSPANAWIMECGIPVVQHDGLHHYNILQRVPSNMDRDNVPSGYLKKLHALALNSLHRSIPPDAMSATFAKTAVESSAIEPEALKDYLDKKYGSNAVAYDPSDIESVARCQSEGRQVVYGRSESSEAWDNIRTKLPDAIPAASKVHPTPKPFSEGGTPITIIPESDYSSRQERIVRLSVDLARRLMNVDLRVRLVKDKNPVANACYRRVSETVGEMTLFVGSLGHMWFSIENLQRVLDLLLDEFGHQYEKNHLSEEYYRALRTLGAKMTCLALTEPKVFQ